jgi:hypothetical protein
MAFVVAEADDEAEDDTTAVFDITKIPVDTKEFGRLAA